MLTACSCLAPLTISQYTNIINKIKFIRSSVDFSLYNMSHINMSYFIILEKYLNTNRSNPLQLNQFFIILKLICSAKLMKYFFIISYTGFIRYIFVNAYSYVHKPYWSINSINFIINPIQIFRFAFFHFVVILFCLINYIKERMLNIK